MNESIQETHFNGSNICNKKANGPTINYVHGKFDISGKEKNRNLNFLSELREMRKIYVINTIVGQLNINSLRSNFCPSNKYCFEI